MAEGWSPEGQDLSAGAGAPVAREEQKDRSRAKELRLVATGVALTLFLWFAFANLQRVHIQFWVASTSAPLIVVVVVSGFLGALVTGLWSWVLRRRRRGERAQ